MLEIIYLILNKIKFVNAKNINAILKIMIKIIAFFLHINSNDIKVKFINILFNSSKGI